LSIRKQLKKSHNKRQLRLEDRIRPQEQQKLRKRKKVTPHLKNDVIERDEAKI